MEWRFISNSHYEVSEIGTVRNSRSGRILKVAVDKHGYAKVGFYIGDKFMSKKVHRLVAEAFLGPRNGLQTNHKNGIKADNRLENLEYLTARDNVHHAQRLGLMRRAKPKARKGRFFKVSLSDINNMKWLYWVGYPVATIAARYKLYEPYTYSLIAGRRDATLFT